MKFKDLEMHKIYNIGFCRVMQRVPGGIIYSEYHNETGETTAYVFVPMCYEFELEIPGLTDDN